MVYLISDLFQLFTSPNSTLTQSHTLINTTLLVESSWTARVAPQETITSFEENPASRGDASNILSVFKGEVVWIIKEEIRIR